MKTVTTTREYDGAGRLIRETVVEYDAPANRNRGAGVTTLVPMRDPYAPRDSAQNTPTRYPDQPVSSV